MKGGKPGRRRALERPETNDRFSPGAGIRVAGAAVLGAAEGLVVVGGAWCGTLALEGHPWRSLWVLPLCFAWGAAVSAAFTPWRRRLRGGVASRASPGLE